MPRNQGTSRKGKPKKADRESGMGRALAKAQTKKFVVKSNGASRHGQGMQSSGAQSIGIEGGGQEIKMKSVLEIDSLSDFILQAEMANKEFSVEREQMIILDQTSSKYDPYAKRVAFEGDGGTSNSFQFSELSVPRRPAWNASMTPEELSNLENEAFLEWRRGIAKQEEVLNRHQIQNSRAGEHPQQQVTVTPYEKNIQVWKQLWRVLEQSACLIQIVDARNPLFYYSRDLSKYCQEELKKPMIVLVNKSDFLTPKQRQMWHEYFSHDSIYHFFFSARAEQDKLDQQSVETSNPIDEVPKTPPMPDKDNNFAEFGNYCLLTRSQLHNALRDFAIKHECKPMDTRYQNRVQFGMVGFPNVGKSSVINVLVGASKHSHQMTRVGVASQPGKTKHFQTVLIPDRDDIMLCDCPGLVFPSFVSSTADMIAAGVYPIDQMRDIYLVMSLLTKRISLRDIWNAKYSIVVPVPSKLALREMNWHEPAHDAEDGLARLNRLPPPTAKEVLDTYCISRNLYATTSGIPDHQKASRTIIKDYVSGKLLYCHPPPISTTDGASPFTKKDEAIFARETLIKALEEELSKKDEFGSVTTSRAKVLQSLEKSARLLSNDEKIGDLVVGDSPEEDIEMPLTDTMDESVLIEDDMLLLDTVEGLSSLKINSNKVKKEKPGVKGKQHKRDRIKARKEGKGTTIFVPSAPVVA